MEAAAQAPEQNSNLFPLAEGERVGTWLDQASDRPRVHIFRQFSKADAKQFYRDSEIQAGDTGGSLQLKRSIALRRLYTACALRVEGYVVKGGADLMTLADWKAAVPRGHQELAASLLLRVSRSAQPLDEIEPGVETVLLDALRPGSKPGEMRLKTGLVHRLAPMTAEDEADMKHELTRQIPVQGSRDGQTIAPTPEAVWLLFYDRLVRSVEGYGCGGRPLESPEEIRQWMDPFHKIEAMKWYLEVPAARLAGPDQGVTEEE